MEFYQKLVLILKVVFHHIFIDYPIVMYDWLTKPKKKSVKGQVAVVTGAAQGMGREMGRLLALRQEAKVVLLDREKGACEMAAEEINEDGGEAFAFSVDVTDPQGLRRVAQEIYDHPELGGVDLVICNAGILNVKILMDSKEEEIRRAIDVNLLGCIWTIRAFLARMMENNSGHVIAVCSIAGLLGCPKLSDYCASKFGVQGFMDSLRWELLDAKKTGVHLTTLYPFFVKTNMIRGHHVLPGIFDVLEPEQAAELMVEAILAEKKDFCLIGQAFPIISGLKWILPARALVTMRKFIDVGFDY